MVQMKKLIIPFIMFLLISHSTFSYDLEYFKQLDAEQQVQLWLKEYQYQEYGWRRLKYAEAIEIFMEKHDEVKPILFDVLKDFEIKSFYSEDKSFNMTYQVLSNSFLSFLTETERINLANLISEKIFDYVKITKIIDSNVIHYTAVKNNLLDLGSKHNIEIGKVNPFDEKSYYTSLGIEGVGIHWVEIEKRYASYGLTEKNCKKK
jgi:hypothetical protein